MAISFPNTFQTASGNVAGKTLDDNFTYTTTLAANATVLSTGSLTGAELILLSQGGLPYSASISSIVSVLGSGTAAQATKLVTARTISVGTDATGTSAGFDGQANVTIPITVVSASTSTAGKVQLAQASDVTTATSTTLAVTPFSLSGLPNGVKAWVRFTGQTSNGTCTILKAYNVSSVTRTSTGNYTIAFANSLADGNYAIVGTAGGTDLTGNGGPPTFSIPSSPSNTASLAYIAVTNTASSQDRSIISVVMFD
jgi:hypothetical protein